MYKRLITPLASVLVIGLVVGGATWGKTQADTVPPIVQEVTHQGEVLDNHEDRITNNEADISKLQDSTATAPSPERTVVREVITQPSSEPIYTAPEPTPEPVPEPDPIVVTSYLQIATNTGYNGENMDCELTYSDGLKYRFSWKTVTYNQQKTTTTQGKCDSSIVGTEYQAAFRT